MPRRFLVYCAADSKRLAPQLFRSDRLFDVALNAWTGDASALPKADFNFSMAGHKWPCAQHNLKDLRDDYDFYAFIDDDILLSTESINALFLLGERHHWRLFQPSILPEPYPATFHPELFHRPFSDFRSARLVEVMTPFFSREALEICWSTFNASESGWGLDFLWANLLRYERMAVVDAIPARHTRPIRSVHWKLASGRTPRDELGSLLAEHQISPPRGPSAYELYQHARQVPSDISEHVPVLFEYGSRANHITEFGTRTCRSTAAFLFSAPQKLVAYDLQRLKEVSLIEAAAERELLEFSFIQADTGRLRTIEPTDLLFIDTLHTREQVAAELRMAEFVRRFIILHDTETFGTRGEDGGEGIWGAVQQFLDLHSEWQIEHRLTNNNGLTILKRVE